MVIGLGRTSGREGCEFCCLEAVGHMLAAIEISPMIAEQWRAKLGAARMMHDIWVSACEFHEATAKASPANVLLNEDLQVILCANRGGGGGVRTGDYKTSAGERVSHVAGQGADWGVGGQAESSILLCKGALSKRGLVAKGGWGGHVESGL